MRLLLWLTTICSLLVAGQTVAPKKNPAGTKLSARDSVTVSAGIPKEELQRETQYNTVFRQAVDLKRNGQYENALAKFEEAERIAASFAHIQGGLVKAIEKQNSKQADFPIIDFRNGALQGVLEQEADTLALLRRFNESEKVSLRRVDVLRVWTNEYDGAFAHNYMELAAVRMLQKDWKGADNYCQQAIKAYDKVIEHFAGSEIQAAERRAKALDMYYVALVYFREGKTTESLDTFESAFNTATELHATTQPLKQMATSARDVALVSGHPIEAVKWELRLHSIDDNPKK